MIVLLLIILSACAPVKAQSIPSTDPLLQTTPPLPTPTGAHLPTQTPLPPRLFLPASMPQDLRRSLLEQWSPYLVDQPFSGNIQLAAQDRPDPLIEWTYALVAPFPTVLDGVTSDELKAAWNGTPSPSFSGQPLLVDDGTLAMLRLAWGEPAAGAVTVLSGDQLLQTAWENRTAWAIVPFGQLDPRWKVLTVDGNSPIRKDFDPAAYPLQVRLGLAGDPQQIKALKSLVSDARQFPLRNRDPQKMTVLVMTGVTALVRATAWTMNQKGILYPSEGILGWLRGADLTHINNEVPFATNCPPPQKKAMITPFCEDPRYIELLEAIGTDIVEMAGNHFQDYGSAATLMTLDMYRQRGWVTYGGGANLAEAEKAVTLEDHGNKLAFISCNPVGPVWDWATEDQPGAAPCDWESMHRQVTDLRAAGYLPIATFQYYEYYTFAPRPQQVIDFGGMADAGAVIVSGSQAHIPQAMTFTPAGSFVHYGLGNLFFDQMHYHIKDRLVEETRWEMLDRHIFYDGKYISTELLTAILEDYARPRPMTPDERKNLLEKLFAASGW